MHARTSGMRYGSSASSHHESYRRTVSSSLLRDFRHLGREMDAGARERVVLELQRAIGNAAVSTAISAATIRRSTGSGVAQRVNVARAGGAQLEDPTKRRLERSFGTRLDGVRIHDDADSDALARVMHAEAFTSGNDIFFRRGGYAPVSGFHTLAHEVAHTVQQAVGSVSGRSVGDGIRMSEPHDAGETAADKAADAAALGHKAEFVQTGGRGTGTPVQRKCGGDCGCAGCSAAKSEEEEVVQTLPSVMTTDVMIQRKPFPNEKFGDFDLMWNPTSSISFTGPDGKAGSESKNETTETFTYDNIPRGSKGQIALDVAMQWFNKAGPPKPTTECDVCGILAKAFTFNLLFFDVPPPTALVEECRKLIKLDPNGVEPLLDQIADAAADPCNNFNRLPFLKDSLLLRAVLTACGVGKFLLNFLPGAGFIKEVQIQLLAGVERARRALRDCKGKTSPQPNTVGTLAGTAQSNMRAVFASQPDGSMVFTGLSPTPFQSGEGGRLTIPVEHLHRTLPDGGSILQQPVLVTTKGTAAVASKQFAAEVRKPADVSYNCEKDNGFGPFKVASDIFEQDDLKHQEIRDFYFGLHPLIRQDVEEGRGLIRITGRASKTGSQAFNMALAEKRANRVKKILRGLMGSSAKDPRIFFLGELGAQTPGCNGKVTGKKCEDAAERRADVVVSGTVPGAGKLDSACSGHIDEPTPSGADFPVVEAADLIELDEALAPVSEPVTANNDFLPAFV